LDADDMLLPEYVEHTLPVLKSAGDDVGYVYTQCRYFGSESGVSQFPQWTLKRLLRWPFVHASALLRTEVVVEHPYDERRRPGVEDWDFYLTLAEHGIRGTLVDEPLLLYRKHGGSSRGDHLEVDPTAERAFHEILRKHWRLGGVRHAARVEGYYLRNQIRRKGAVMLARRQRRVSAS
jgi:O-antigen biosynthesis protein